MEHTRRRFIGATSIAFVIGAPLAARAQEYPNKPLRLVIPYPGGGGTDVVGRLLADKLRVRLGQPIIVDNRPGAATIVGANFVAKAPPDGYTIMVHTSAFTSSPALVKAMPYDTMKDIAPIGSLAKLLICLAMDPSLPVQTFPELVAYMKANPGKLNYASSGIGSSNHLAMESLLRAAGITATHVPYKGAGAVYPDLMSGRVHLLLDQLVTAATYVRSGKLRAVALTSSARSNLWPGMPTVAETVPGYSYEPWIAVFGPGGLPAPIVGRLNREINSILTDDPDVRQRMDQLSLEAQPGSPEQLADIVRKDLVMWRETAKAAGVEPE